VATFLVERYWPGVTAAAAEAATDNVAGRAVRPPGRRFRQPRIMVVETIVAAADEVCFWYVEAATEDEITYAFQAAGIPVDRIGPATALPDLRGVPPHVNPPARG
jgi:hypothetical protein